jgi:hypothetical protein
MAEEYRGSDVQLDPYLTSSLEGVTDVNIPAAIPRERNARYQLNKRLLNGPQKQVRAFSRRGTFHTRVENKQYTTLTPSEYTNRHNKVAVYIHWPICKHVRLQGPDKYCQHIPERVIYVNGKRVSQIEQY